MHLDAPSPDLMATSEERGVVQDLARQAAAVPAMARLREVVAFVGRGRPATQGGNLKAADALALARRLAPAGPVPDDVRSMDEVAEAAHAFRWAMAAELLARRGARIVPGPLAGDLERDPLGAWMKATVTLLDRGLLDGFRQGWRKSYVELLDDSAAGLVLAVGASGGALPLAAVEEGGWHEVAAAYGYEPDDETERARVVALLGAMVDELAHLGVLTRHDDEVALTPLGHTLATFLALLADDEDEDDLDLVDTDAESLLLVCSEGMDPAEATAHLVAWLEARPGDEAAAELCEAMLDSDDPEVWALGFEALDMIDRLVAEPAVRRLRSHPGLRPVAKDWLRRPGPGPVR